MGILDQLNKPPADFPESRFLKLHAVFANETIEGFARVFLMLEKSRASCGWAREDVSRCTRQVRISLEYDREDLKQ